MPSGIEIQRVADEDALATAAAGLFARLSRKALADRGRFTVAISGGSVSRRVFEALAAPPLCDQVPWEGIEFFWCDERALPPEHEESSYGMACESLLDAVPVVRDRVHRIRGEQPDLKGAAGEYAAEIARVFGASESGPAPSFDFVILGMGLDGLAASPPSGMHGAEPTNPWIVASGAPEDRLAMTPELINRARCVAFLVVGASQAQDTAAALEGPRDPERFPSQRIRPSSGRLIWFVDRAASSCLGGQVAGEVRLAPSILSADFARLGEEVGVAERAGADRIHVDVMDGHFVPNISIGTVVVRSLRRVSALPLETHLMISEPDRYAEAFAEAGSDRILFHREVSEDPVGLARRIRDLGASPGIVINPETHAASIAEVLPWVDLALVMTVHPGFGGQRFIEEMVGKIAEVRRMIDGENPTCDLEVDGGIDPDTVGRAVDAGARVLVAGSAIFEQKGGIEEAMERLRRSAERSAATRLR